MSLLDSVRRLRVTSAGTALVDVGLSQAVERRQCWVAARSQGQTEQFSSQERLVPV